MAWRIELSDEAKRSLAKLDPQIARRILSFLHQRLAQRDDPRSLAEPLKGLRFSTLCRYRVGDYRIIASIEDEVMRVLVLKVGHRREVYEKGKRV